MGNKEDEDFYINHSKKELQCLCKKYGLSPHKTKPNLVKSLVSYLQKKTLSSLTSCERLSCEDALLPTSLMLQRHPGSQLNFMLDGRKDIYGIISDHREEVKEGNNLQTLRCNNLGSCTGAETYDKASCNGISEGFGSTVYNHPETSHTQCVFHYDGSNFNYGKETPKINYDNNKLEFSREGEHMPQIQSRNKKIGPCATNPALANPMTSSTKVPSSSFEFNVRSEEGIKLFVDLNSIPSDWSARLKNGVCMFHCVQNNKSRSLHQNLGWFGSNNNHVVENGQDGIDVSLRSSALRPCSTAVNFSGTSDEDQAVLLSSRPSLNIQGRISGTEFCPGDEGTLTLDSDASDTWTIKSACDAALNLVSDGARSRHTWEHQISMVDNGHCENSTMRIPCSLVNTGGLPGCSTSGSIEVQSFEVARAPKDALRPSCDIGDFLSRVDPSHNVEAENGELANPSKLNHDTCGNNLSTSVEQLVGKSSSLKARSNLIHRRESSECLQYDNSIEKVFLRCDSEFSERLLKKRQCNNSPDNNSAGKPDSTIFKSLKRHSSEVFPRRSMRLGRMQSRGNHKDGRMQLHVIPKATCEPCLKESLYYCSKAGIQYTIARFIGEYVDYPK